MLERIRIGLLGLLACSQASSLVTARIQARLPRRLRLRPRRPSMSHPPTSPQTPVRSQRSRRFLIAEIAGDFEASFELLSQADQEAAGGVEGWVAEHYLVVPTIRGFRLTADTTEANRAEVVADLSLQAGLDQLVGLIPADADATWVVVEEAGDWRVAFAESRIDPVFLDDAHRTDGCCRMGCQPPVVRARNGGRLRSPGLSDAR